MESISAANRPAAPARAARWPRGDPDDAGRTTARRSARRRASAGCRSRAGAGADERDGDDRQQRRRLRLELRLAEEETSAGRTARRRRRPACPGHDAQKPTPTAPDDVGVRSRDQQLDRRRRAAAKPVTTASRGCAAAARPGERRRRARAPREHAQTGSTLP